jgi:hypothetical protein
MTVSFWVSVGRQGYTVPANIFIEFVDIVSKLVFCDELADDSGWTQAHHH